MPHRNRKFIKRNRYRKLKNLANIPNNAVVNLSNHKLTEPQLTLLAKGLGFSPIPAPQHKISLIRDTLLFNRTIRLQHHFQVKERTATTPADPYKPPSGWVPKASQNKQLDAYLNVITEEIVNDLNTPKRRYHNISREERTAITELRENPNIIIKPADKGGAVVILNLHEYLQEAHRQLEDRDTYTKLNEDLNPKITKEITNFVNSINNKISTNLAKYIIPKNWRTPIFYLLPKIHKPGNPGRPIVSAINAPTANMSEVVDNILKPLAQNVKSYLKDTTQFLNEINKITPIPQNSILMTADVKSLYTSIPHREGILATKEKLETRAEKEIPTWIILRFIHFILTKNCFEFNNEFYLQTNGTSMGTKMAPEYAIIFMDNLEQKFLESQPHKPLVWLRYIDDIFMIWPHSCEALDAFKISLNSYHKTIKFTFETSDTEIHFLDTIIKKDNQGNLITSLYTKPTDAHLYLHYNSCHPQSQKRSIPYSQAIRIR